MWDYLNRMLASGFNNSTTSYAYDEFGSRVMQTSTTSTTYYPNKYFSTMSTIVGSTTYATSTNYIWNGDTLLATIDQPMINGTATGTPITRYIHPDHLGSTNAVTDQNGNLMQLMDYYPYGATRIATSTYPTNEKRQYIDQFMDAQTGLDYLNARYYNSTQGQFISEDPMFLAIGNPNQIQQLTQQQQAQLLANPQQLNSYSYSHDNPITSKDPQGLVGVEAVFATPAGMVIGAMGQAVSDYRSGQLSPITDYWASEFGGAIGLNLALDSDGLGIPLSTAVGGGSTEAAKEFFNNVKGTQKGFNILSIGTEAIYTSVFSTFIPEFEFAPVNSLTSYGARMLSAPASDVFASLSNTLRAASAIISSQAIKGAPSTVAQGVFEGGGGLAGIKQSLTNILSTLQSLSAPTSNNKTSSH